MPLVKIQFGEFGRVWIQNTRFIDSRKRQMPLVNFILDGYGRFLYCIERTHSDSMVNRFKINLRMIEGASCNGKFEKYILPLVVYWQNAGE